MDEKSFKSFVQGLGMKGSSRWDEKGFNSFVRRLGMKHSKSLG